MCSIVEESNCHTGWMKDVEVTDLGITIIRREVTIEFNLEELSQREILCDLIGSVLNSGKHCDATLVTADKQFAVHKIILTDQPLLRNLINDSSLMSMADVSGDVAEQLLEYIYTGKVTRLEKYSQELLIIADKYNLDLLKQMCELSLCQSLDTASSIALLQLAHLHSATQLQLACVDYIVNHSLQVMITDQWNVMFNEQPYLFEIFHNLAIERHPIIFENDLKTYPFDNSIINDQLEESVSDSHSVKYHFYDRWTIENVSVLFTDSLGDYSYIVSAKFCPPYKPGHQFRLHLYPKGCNEKYENYLALYLNYCSVQEDEILPVYSIITIIDKNGEKFLYKGYTDIFSSDSPHWGWRTFVSRNDLFDPAKGLLNEDRLTFHSELIFYKTVTRPIESYSNYKNLSRKAIFDLLNSLLENDNQTDVTLAFGEEAKEIKVHKFWFATCSHAFEDMFKCHDTMEKQSSLVLMPEVSAEVGEQLVRFIYTGKVINLEMYAQELLVFAGKYELDNLKQMCALAQCGQIVTESAFLANDHNELKQSSIDYTEHASNVTEANALQIETMD